MQVLQRQRDFRRVEASALLGELLRFTQVVEELAAGTVVENEVELVALGRNAILAIRSGRRISCPR